MSKKILRDCPLKLGTQFLFNITFHFSKAAKEVLPTFEKSLIALKGFKKQVERQSHFSIAIRETISLLKISEGNQICASRNRKKEIEHVIPLELSMNQMYQKKIIKNNHGAVK